MDENDTPYVLNALQKKSTELFQQSVIYEAKFQRQNDIIEQLQKSIEELRQQLQNIPKSNQRRKKIEDKSDF